MSDHFLVQKSLVTSIKDSELTPGQPKILDYLQNHNGCVQKEIAKGCHIEPASITVILKGMESKGYIERKMLNGDRRSLYVFLTEKGKKYIEYLNEKFDKVENTALKNFSEDEKQQLNDLLMRVYENMIANEKEEI
ncbi:MarR family winged helix-turn-helix transcriptional regulator [uncultured Ruminococcus sp.]|uniref:MarR family winged helix-turn-helix transcriptional regulator n=1 Tax=uncultured Ruminococcus sp. TaxID=165186 RepID=UPI0026DAB51B|nr:MarR family transcriptional regulator [uncultured Ruminococcus sp.]